MDETEVTPVSGWVWLVLGAIVVLIVAAILFSGQGRRHGGRRHRRHRHDRHHHRGHGESRD
jgi:hypothetical protein